MAELKPCPLCGKTPALGRGNTYITTWFRYECFNYSYRRGCQFCKHIFFAKKPETALKNWNKAVRKYEKGGAE